MRVDFFHADRREILEMRSSGEPAKWPIGRLIALKKIGYSVRVISDTDEI